MLFIHSFLITVKSLKSYLSQETIFGDDSSSSHCGINMWEEIHEW